MAHESVNLVTSEAAFRRLQDQLYATTRHAMERRELPRFQGLLEIAQSEAVILTAIHKIKSNRGQHTAGSDGQVMSDILQQQYPDVIQRVQSAFHHYEPELLRRVWIPKPGKADKRPLGIPAVIDRIVQEVLRSILEPIMEAQFFDHSYGFRPMRDAHQALARATNLVHDTGYHWIVEGDIKGCFDNIPHGKLLKQLWHMGIRDQRILMMIKQMLKAGILHEAARVDQGTPQGGILSPLLANVYLHKLDQWVTREWEAKRTRFPYKARRHRMEALQERSRLKPAYFVRYADDWILITDTKAHAVAWKQRIAHYLDSNLGLTLSQDKTKITSVRRQSIHFLGFQFKLKSGKSRTGYVTVTRPDAKRLRDKVVDIRRELRQLRRYQGKALCHAINVVNSRIVGLNNYYQVASMVNPDCRRYADSLARTAHRALRRALGNRKTSRNLWTPAHTVHNLTERHADFTKAIPTVEYEGLRFGVTNLAFVRWTEPKLKRPAECPYTAKGRNLYDTRTGHTLQQARDDPGMNLTLSAIIAFGQTHPRYNFEYLLNRAYAYNRDQRMCRVCDEWVLPAHLHMHHIDPSKPLDEVNKVANLATMHRDCHQRVHDGQPHSELGAKQRQKLRHYRQLPNLSTPH